MRPAPLALWLSLLAGLPAMPAAALQPGDIGEAQAAQHDWIDRNGGRADQQRDLEAQLAYVDQNVNFAMIDQLEGTGQHGEIEQRGNGNLALLGQGFGNDNRARLVQDGEQNYAVVTQGGNGNVVTLLNQLGNDDRVTLSQQGDNNEATVQQQGDSNRLDLRQIDSYNVANIEQYGNTDLTITQSNPGGNPAAVNSLEFRGYTEPGSDPLVRTITLDGPQSRALFLCNGSAAYCESVH